MTLSWLSAGGYFLRAGVRHSRGEVVFEGVYLLLMSAILMTWINVWAMMPDSVLASFDLSFVQIVWYVCCTEIVAFSVPKLHREIELMIYEGRFASLLLRPFPWLIEWLAGHIGQGLVFLLFFAGASSLVALAATGAWLLSPSVLPFLLLHLVFAQAIWMVWMTIIGLSVPWLGSASTLYMIVQKFAFIFGGLLLPIALYPGWLAALAYVTPFPAIFGVVGEVVLDPSWAHFVRAAAYQFLVLGASLLVLLWLWRRFVTHLLQEG